MSAFPYKRIVVIGTTSSGKSTLAKRLADGFGFDFIELDALHWEQNWKVAEKEIFRERARAATQVESWVAAGNYSQVRDIVWSRAELIIWLDYPFHIVLWRLLTRTIRRGITQERLWNGNREKVWWHLRIWSEDSLIHWLFKTYWRRKREIPKLLSLPEHNHLRHLHFKHPHEAEAWLTNLSSSPEKKLKTS